MEIWKTVKINGVIHNDYECSTHGRVRNIKNKRSMKCTKIKSGYQTTSIGRDTYLVHRIIAETFLPNIDNRETVNHINNKRDDNRVDNLEWATHLEQNKHMNKTNNVKRNKSMRVCQIQKLDNKILNKFESYKEAAEFLGKNINQVQTVIGMCLSGRRKSAYGYFWKIDQIDNLENEKWKIVNELNNKYAVSNYGRLKRTENNLILKQKPHDSGYQIFKFNDDGKSYSVHRLVAKYFITEDIEGKVVNHKDLNRSNNHVNNLEVTTQKQNVIHSMKNRPSVKKVIQYDNDGNIIRIYDHCVQASEILNIDRSAIYYYCKQNRVAEEDKMKFKYLTEKDDLINNKICFDDIKKAKTNWKRNGTPKKVTVYKNNIETKTYQSIADASKENGYAKLTIAGQCKGVAKYPMTGDINFRFTSDIQKYTLYDVPEIFKLASTVYVDDKHKLQNFILWYPDNLYTKDYMLKYPIEKLIPTQVMQKNISIQKILQRLYDKEKTKNKNFIILVYKYIHDLYINA